MQTTPPAVKSSEKKRCRGRSKISVTEPQIRVLDKQSYIFLLKLKFWVIHNQENTENGLKHIQMTKNCS